MSIRLRMNIREGVSRGLCGSCRYSHRHTYNNETEFVSCVLLSGLPGQTAVITRPVVDCSDYDKLGEMNLNEMEGKAWIIEVKSGKVMGFKPPKPKDDDF